MKITIFLNLIKIIHFFTDFNSLEIKKKKKTFDTPVFEN